MDYAKIAETVERLIRKNGRAIDLKKITSAPADANKPWRGGTSETVFPTIGCFVPASGDSLGKQLIRDDLLLRCDEVLLVAPTKDDLSKITTVVDFAIEWTVEWVHVLQPGATICLYAMGVKR